MRSILEAVERKLSFVSRYADYVAGGLIVVLTLDIFLEVVFRYLLSMPIKFSSEFAMIIFPWMVFLSAITITWKDEHIGIVVFRQAQKGVRRKTIEVIINLTMLGFSGVMLFAGWELAWRLTGNTLPISGFSKTVMYVSMPVAFVMFVLILAVRILRILLTDYDAETDLPHDAAAEDSPAV